MKKILLTISIASCLFAGQYQGYGKYDSEAEHIIKTNMTLKIEDLKSQVILTGIICS